MHAQILSKEYKKLWNEGIPFSRRFFHTEIQLKVENCVDEENENKKEVDSR